MSLIQVPLAVRKADLVVFGGGSLLQDATSLRSLFYYLSIIELSRLFQKPVAVYANGIGPINSGLGRKLTRQTLSKVKSISVRDLESKIELANLGVRAKVEVTADPAFLLNPAPASRAESILKDSGIKDSRGIVWISLRHVNSPPWLLEQLTDAVIWLRKQAFMPCFFAMQERDLAVAQALNRKLTHSGQEPMKAVSNLSPTDALGVLKKGEFCLGMRLHTLILSARVKVPFMGIEIDPKIGAFCRSTGCPLLPCPAVEPNFCIKEEFAPFMDSRDKLRQLLVDKLPEFRSLAQKNIDMLLNCLD